MARVYDLPDKILRQICDVASPSAQLMMKLTSVKLRDNIQKLPRIAKDAVIDDAIHHGSPEVIKFLCTDEKYPLTVDLFNDCVAAGHIRVVQWLMSVNCPKHPFVCETAALYNHFELLVILHQNIPNISTSCHQYAARNGNVEMMEWLQIIYPYYTRYLLQDAVEHQHMIDWIHANIGYAREDISICNNAAKGGHLFVLKRLIDDGYQWDRYDIICAAIHSGKLPVVEYVHSIGGQLTEYAYYTAAYRGFLDILLWLISHNCPKSRKTCHSAYVQRHLHIIEWIAENPTECTCKRTHSHANGHTKLMNKLKHERGLI